MKYKDIHGLSDKDLKDRLAEEKEALLKLKFTHAVSQVESTARMPATRKVIARILTEKRVRLQAKNNEPKAE
jgi:large subunit ribosomal protein L29